MTQALLQKSRLKCKGKGSTTKKYPRLKKSKGIRRIKTKQFQSPSTKASLKFLRTLKVILVTQEKLIHFR